MSKAYNPNPPVKNPYKPTPMYMPTFRVKPEAKELKQEKKSRIVFTIDE